MEHLTNTSNRFHSIDFVNCLADSIEFLESLTIDTYKLRTKDHSVNSQLLLL